MCNCCHCVSSSLFSSPSNPWGLKKFHSVVILNYFTVNRLHREYNRRFHINQQLCFKTQQVSEGVVGVTPDVKGILKCSKLQFSALQNILFWPNLRAVSQHSEKEIQWKSTNKNISEKLKCIKLLKSMLIQISHASISVLVSKYHLNLITNRTFQNFVFKLLRKKSSNKNPSTSLTPYSWIKAIMGKANTVTQNLDISQKGLLRIS